METAPTTLESTVTVSEVANWSPPLTVMVPGRMVSTTMLSLSVSSLSSASLYWAVTVRSPSPAGNVTASASA